MSILLSSMNQMFADGFQLVIDFVGLDDVGPEGVAQGVGHGTHDTVLKMKESSLELKIKIFC